MKSNIKILKISRGISFKSIAEKKGKKMSVLTYVYILFERACSFIYLSDVTLLLHKRYMKRHLQRTREIEREREKKR